MNGREASRWLGRALILLPLFMLASCPSDIYYERMELTPRCNGVDHRCYRATTLWKVRQLSYWEGGETSEEVVEVWYTFASGAATFPPVVCRAARSRCLDGGYDFERCGNRIVPVDSGNLFTFSDRTVRPSGCREPIPLGNFYPWTSTKRYR